MDIDPDAPADLAGLFEAQAAATPDAVAAVARGTSLTYRQLDVSADRLAADLRGLGVGTDVAVGICVERGLEFDLAVLGVLKAGGACLPLDPTYPPARLAFMLGDAAPRVVLTRDTLAGRLPDHAGATLILDGLADATAAASLSTAPAERPPRAAAPDQVGYILYTSGSTGRPNGVMLVNRGLINHARAAVDIYGLGPGDRVLQFCSISFDVSVEELFPTWASGATVVSRDENIPILGRAWLDWLIAQGVTLVNLPTAYWHAWVRDLSSLGDKVPEAIRTVIVGGEKALGSVYRDWLVVGGDRPRWFNAYGPTEATVMATIHEAPAGAGDGQDPPVGRPLPGVEIHLLDAERRPVPAGTVGQIFIGGDGLARGYLGRPDLTAERFVFDPFSSRPGARLYRTGDLGRIRADGELDFVGRADDQVKVRGFRIECGEVEGALRAHPAVGEAVVVAREDAPGDRRLVAYVVGRGATGPSPDGPDLRRFLAARLPSYMVPGAFVPLDALPLTNNGKVDRDALPAPGEARVGRGGGAPLTPTEKLLAGIWSDVLGIEGIGPDDDFFELGGHSLLAAQVVARIQGELGAQLGLQTVFDAPTVNALAAVVDAQARGPAGAGPPALVAHPRPSGIAAPFPLSLPQEQMWEVQTRAGTRVDNNVTAWLRLPPPLDPQALRLALVALVERHESLRTSFPTEGGRPLQSVASSVPVELAVTDLGASAEHGDADLHDRIAALDREPFDPDRSPLFRFHLFSLGGRGGVAALVFDHMVCDGPSAYIVLSELAEAYQALARGERPRLRPLPVDYADFSMWQRTGLSDERLGEQLEYWTHKLAGMALGPALPFDHLPPTPTRRIVTRPLGVERSTFRSLDRLARRCRASIFVVCVAAVSAVLSRLGSTDDVVLSTTLSGRGRPELEGVVGNFAGTGRLRTDVSGDPPFAEVVERARGSVLGLFEHQDIPFFRVRDALMPHFAAQGAGGRPPFALLPVELQYFRAAHDHWAPGASVVESPGPGGEQADRPAGGLFFRGQLHPLSVTLFDDGDLLWGQISYKVDFYEPETIEALATGIERVLDAVAQDSSMLLSALPVAP
ncbi:MAG TPA: amino acid adenylation domain-containing protein [Acidimicrobiales bacterium]|nr:amino acid adenylation domain-containing protein [Acidimicrobiales bacterium]